MSYRFDENDGNFATVSDLIRHRAASHPNKKFIKFETESISYAESNSRIDKICWKLTAMGVSKGNKVAVMLENSLYSVETWIALARMGAVEVSIGAALKGESLVYPLHLTECATLITTRSIAERHKGTFDSIPSLVNVVVAEDLYAEKIRNLIHGNFRDEDSIPSKGPYFVEVAPMDSAIILFSSGTTGPPKGVVLSHLANFRLAASVVDAMNYGPDDVLFNFFPLSHVNARYTTVLAAMIANATAIIHGRFSASKFWDICRENGVTAFNFMGAIPVILMAQDASANDRSHRLSKEYGSGAAGQIARDFSDRFNVKLVETYGSTELGMVTHTPLGEVSDNGTCGNATPGYEIAILGSPGTLAEPGETGEIVVRTAAPGLVFSEYYDNPTATADAWSDQWFHTGDRGYLDSSGALFFVDRVKDAIRRRGENISSWEVERAVESHPAVAEAAAIGIPSDVSGEEVLVVVVLRDSAEPESILRHAEMHLPHYAVPRYVRFVGELPRTVSARVEKYRLRNEGLTSDAWDAESNGFRARR